MSDSIEGFIRTDRSSFLELILDCVSDCLVVADPDGVIVMINQPYCDLLGGVAADFVGRKVHDVISPHSRLPAVARGGSPVIGHILNVRGRDIVTKQVPIWRDGQIIGALGMALFASTSAATRALHTLPGRSIVLPTSREPLWRTRYVLDDIVGRGPEMHALKEQIRRLASIRLPLSIHGETGTGKELVAQAIHAASPRAEKPFVWMNCTTIPNELVASEMFGYEAGSFTGSSAKGAKGKLELANEGTLFLDEIADLPLGAQGGLLRFLQEGEVVRVGGSKPIRLDVRVISASHKDLAAQVQAGLFREDLFYRLRVLSITVPPLRARSDIDSMINHLIARVRIDLALPHLSVSTKAALQLRQYDWPGNVRQMLSVLQRAAVSLPDGHSVIESFSELDTPTSPAAPSSGRLDTAIASTEREAIVAALTAADGNRSQAARRLGIDRTSFYKRLRHHGLMSFGR